MLRKSSIAIFVAATSALSIATNEGMISKAGEMIKVV